MNNKIQEAIIMRGIAASIQSMKFPSLEAVNIMLKNVGYLLLDNNKYTFISFGKHQKSYSEAVSYATKVIMDRNLHGKPEDCVIIKPNN